MKKSAFSLVELSVVVVIVSILVAGIFMGSGLVNNARLSNAKAHTAKSVVRDIDGLVTWYETTTKESFNPGETYDGAEISEWRDIAPSSKTGLTNHNILSASTASANITYADTGINDIPSIAFTGSSNLTLANFYQGTSVQKTIFLVFRPLSLSAPQTLLDSISGNSSSISIKDSDEITLNAGSTAQTSIATNPASFSIAEDYIMAIYFDSGNSRAYLNDSANEVGGGNINPGSNELVGLTIGTNNSSSSGFNGLISEIIIFNRTLKEQERKDIMSYLATKYKITVLGL